ncbi:hypothetical protein DFH07DRAFT_965369 [Mycena maculata]|uniref:Uncharacterized protein n=1 Tax=Mycena maculata TaxID=230809 RepID=A0AAD7ICW4_9AGAR|nr:hypothetical protein DFH07DRAFT_965369 [Mycena maculata]
MDPSSTPPGSPATAHGFSVPPASTTPPGSPAPVREFSVPPASTTLPGSPTPARDVSVPPASTTPLGSPTPAREFSVPPASTTPPGSPAPAREFSVPPASAAPNPDIDGSTWVKELVVIVEQQKTAQRRHRAGEAKEKPSKTGWVFGTKLKFFEARKEKWLAVAGDKTATGTFYTKMARLYTLKYGYHLGDKEDLAKDIPDPPDEEADKVVNEVLDEEETAFRTAHFKALRVRIGAWYRSHYGALVKSDKAAFAEIFTGVLDGAPPKPTHPQLLQYWSRHFYDEKIKACFEARFKGLKRKADMDGTEQPEVLKVRRIVTAECWADEPASQQAEVKLAQEREYVAAVKAWEESLKDSPTRTAEEMAATLENAAYYVQPFVDAIQARFGMAVSLLIVHAGETRGLAPQIWPLFDKVGFGEVEKSMIAFGKECFSEAECRARMFTPKGKGSRGVLSNAEASGSGTSNGEASVSGGTSTRNVATGSGSTSTGSSSVAARGPSTSAPPALASGVASGSAEGVGGSGSEAQMDVDEVVPMQPPGESDGSEEERLAARIDKIWQRDDRAEWPAELARAHAAFERGKGWGIEWASCVDSFFAFEAAWGYGEDGMQITAKERPQAVKAWLVRARNWATVVDLGELGKQGAEGTFVDQWWTWWMSLQPVERFSTSGSMTCSENADWSSLVKLHGKNGLLQVMAMLLWWGDAMGDKAKSDPFGYLEWTCAVTDVEARAMGEMLRPGVIHAKEGGKKRKRGEEQSDGGGKKKKGAKAVIESSRRTRSSEQWLEFQDCANNTIRTVGVFNFKDRFTPSNATEDLLDAINNQVDMYNIILARQRFLHSRRHLEAFDIRPSGEQNVASDAAPLPDLAPHPPGLSEHAASTIKRYTMPEGPEAAQIVEEFDQAAGIWQNRDEVFATLDQPASDFEGMDDPLKNDRGEGSSRAAR